MDEVLALLIAHLLYTVVLGASLKVSFLNVLELYQTASFEHHKLWYCMNLTKDGIICSKVGEFYYYCYYWKTLL
jgi:hypothetical protein